MRFLTTILMTFCFVGTAMATSLPEMGQVVNAVCVTGKLNPGAVTKSLELRQQGFVTLSVAKNLVFDLKTRLAKSGYGVIESQEKLALILPSTLENPYCVETRLVPATKNQPETEESVPVGMVVITIKKH